MPPGGAAQHSSTGSSNPGGPGCAPEPGGWCRSENTLGHCLDLGHHVPYWEGLGRRWVEGGGRTSLCSWRGARQGEGWARTRSRGPCPGSRIRGRVSCLACLSGVGRNVSGTDLPRHCSGDTQGSAGRRLALPTWACFPFGNRLATFPHSLPRGPRDGPLQAERPSPTCSGAAGPVAAVLRAQGQAPRGLYRPECPASPGQAHPSWVLRVCWVGVQQWWQGHGPHPDPPSPGASQPWGPHGRLTGQFQYLG